MKIKIKNISELNFSKYNPRKLTKKEYKELKASLKKFGLVDPIICNINDERKNVIIGGHQRTKIWSELGNKTVPCIELNLDLEKEKELNIRLNKNTGSWDFDIMGNNFDLENLVEWGFKESEVFAEYETKEKNPTPDDCIVECFTINKNCYGAKVWEQKTNCKIKEKDLA
tara:strand:+ start:79 stop:588 length:510 start_codon:yes stop_codon:yes gene_type:complete